MKRIAPSLFLILALAGHSPAAEPPAPARANPGYSIRVSPAAIAPGGTITIQWTAPDSHPARDFIGLCEKAEADKPLNSGQWTWSQPVPTGTAGRVNLPWNVPGEYVLRFQSDGKDVARCPAL